MQLQRDRQPTSPSYDLRHRNASKKARKRALHLHNNSNPANETRNRATAVQTYPKNNTAPSEPKWIHKSHRKSGPDSEKTGDDPQSAQIPQTASASVFHFPRLHNKEAPPHNYTLQHKTSENPRRKGCSLSIVSSSARSTARGSKCLTRMRATKGSVGVTWRSAVKHYCSTRRRKETRERRDRALLRSPAANASTCSGRRHFRHRWRAAFCLLLLFSIRK